MDEGREVFVDTLVGPTYHFGGLSQGNIASKQHQGGRGKPRKAALEGLEKMWRIAQRGISQLILPPQVRPTIDFLRAWGWKGSDEEVIVQASQENPDLFRACCSSSSMWTANIATFTPSHDTEDRRSHITPASLLTQFHRTLEVPDNQAHLQTLLPSPPFIHHAPLSFPNEGAANHIRLYDKSDRPGIHLFVYGKCGLRTTNLKPQQFPAREAKESVEALQRLHQIPERLTILAQQSPEAIDAGFFHNDLIAMGNRTLLICHEKAFVNTLSIIAEITTKAKKAANFTPTILVIKEEELSLEDLLRSYFCNGQLLSLPEGGQWLLLPLACKTIPSVQQWIHKYLTPLSIEITYLPLEESVKNGGGPACLRLPLFLTEMEHKAIGSTAWLNHSLYNFLYTFIETQYPEEFSWDNLTLPGYYDKIKEIVQTMRDRILPA